MLHTRAECTFSGRTLRSKSAQQSDHFGDDEKSGHDSDECTESGDQGQTTSTPSERDSDRVFQDLSQLDEEELVNSEEFARELQAAINHVQTIAKIDRQKMLAAAREHYRRETGDDPTQQMMDDAMRTFVATETDIDNEIEADDKRARDTDHTDADDDSDSEEQQTESQSTNEQGSEDPEESEVDEQSVSTQLKIALGGIRRVASVYREEFVNKICDIYHNIKGEEPSVMELHRMVDQIKQQFAEEADEDEDADESTESETQSASTIENADESEEEDESEDELGEALAHVRELGAAHQAEVVDRICDIYEEMHGVEPSTAELYDIFGDIKQRLAEEAEQNTDTDESDESDEEDREFRREMDFALHHVRELGRIHQTRFVDAVCKIYRDANGEEPDTADLHAMWYVIKKSFADEAAEDETDETESDSTSEEDDEADESQSECDTQDTVEATDEDEDEEYDPNEDEFDYTRDAQDRIDFGIFAKAEVSNPQSDVEEVDNDEQEEFNGDDESEQSDSEQISSEEETEAVSEDDFQDPFDIEMAIALEHVRKLGRFHQQSLVESACDLFSTVNGTEPTTDELREIFAGIRGDFAGEAAEDAASQSEDDSVSESECDEAESEESDFRTDEEEEEESQALTESELDREADEEDDFTGMMDSALEHVRKLGQLHQQHLADRISDHYAHVNGHEMSCQQLRAAFERVRDIEGFELAENDDVTSEDEESGSEVASEGDFSDDNDNVTSSEDVGSDSDYDPQLDEFDYTRDVQDRIDLGLFPDNDVLTSTDESEYSVARESVVLEVLSSEMQSALQRVRKRGKEHQTALMAKVCDAYEVEQQEKDGDDEDSLSMFADIADRKDFESALDSVRTLGGWHQESFVNRICDDFVDRNGTEPTLLELHGLIGDIKQSFAEEANENDDEAESTVTADADQHELDEVNSAHFATELASAMDNASKMGQLAGRAMLQKVRAQFEDEFGDGDLDRMMVDAMQPFGVDPKQESEETEKIADESETDEEAVAELAEQMEMAMQHTRELGRLHQRELVDTICDIYADLNGKEPTLQNLRQIFGRVRESFAEETKREFFERFGGNADLDGVDSDDSDYDVKRDAFDYRDDLWDDVLYNDDDADDGDEEYNARDEDEADYAQDEIDEQATESSDVEECGDDDNVGGSEASYDPEMDTFDYCDDIEDDHAEESNEEEQSEEEDADYNPNYDTFNYSADEAEDVEASDEEDETEADDESAETGEESD